MTSRASPESCSTKAADAKVELVAKLKAIRSEVDVFHPDMRVAARSVFEAQEKVWKLVPDILTALEVADTRQDGGAFKMQRGPSLPWATAELIYEAYARLYGTQQSLQRLHERGGFGWGEVAVIFSELQKREPKLHAELLARSKRTTP
jgi:hypothetical protein